MAASAARSSPSGTHTNDPPAGHRDRGLSFRREYAVETTHGRARPVATCQPAPDPPEPLGQDHLHPGDDEDQGQEATDGDRLEALAPEVRANPAASNYGSRPDRKLGRHGSDA